MKIGCIAIIGLGEVGRILVEDLLEHTDVQLRLWDHQFGEANSRAARNLVEFAFNSRISVAEMADTAADGCQLLISAVTANEAFNAARSVLFSLERGSIYIDLNSVSPGTKKKISELIDGNGGRFVEAAVMSPIIPLRSRSPILLGGSHAAAFVPVGSALGFGSLSVASDTLGVASATKMCRSIIVKGLEALVTESLLTSRYYGVEDSVLSSLENLFPGPDWQAHAHYLISRSLQHGERRAAEMQEVAKTVREAGSVPWMSLATVERQAWAPQFSSALDEVSLPGMLDSIREQLPMTDTTGLN